MGDLQARVEALEARMAALEEALNAKRRKPISKITEFDRFWFIYPRKVAKATAHKAYNKARKVAEAEEILEGVRRYVAGKPDYQDWAHPATWLNGERWLDGDLTLARAPHQSEVDDVIIRAARQADGNARRDSNAGNQADEHDRLEEPDPEHGYTGLRRDL